MQWVDLCNMMRCVRFVVGGAAAFALLAWPAHGQSLKLPNPSRTVFKCEVNGKVVYSDDPCLGAQRIDVEPTRGLDKSSGRQATGADVRRETTREALVEAFRPVTGLDKSRFDSTARRQNLTASAKTECGDLDGRIADAETLERSASVGTRPAVQRDLLGLRKRYRELRC